MRKKCAYLHTRSTGHDMADISHPAISTRKKKIIVFDTETTGLLPYDRIITIGAVRIEGDELLNQPLYLIFDPRKDSSPQAEAVHGFDNWMTRYQDLFADLARSLRDWFSWADEIVAHNVEFDMRYIQREFRKAEVEMLTQPVHCTMDGARKLWRGKSAKLDDCLSSRFIACGDPPWRHGRRLLDSGALFTPARIASGVANHRSIAGAKTLKPIQIAP